MAALPLVIELDPEEPEAGNVLVDGSVGGHPYRFLLDTGAATSRVAYDDYTVGFASTAAHPSSGVFAPSHDDLITVPSIQIGPISRTNFTLARATAGAQHAANLVGMDILKDFRLYVDFAGHRLEIDGPDRLSNGRSWHAVRMGRRFHPYVEVRLGDTTAQAVWDTGSSLTVADRRFVDRHPTYFTQIGDSTGTDSSGFEAASPLYVMTGALIGASVFPPHRVAAIDLSGVNATLEIPMNLILGYSTLRHADWLLDFPRARWSFLRAP
ncbi:MAG TPA: retropepsin-like aspartic protease [Candidatus Dormibacteraeota bacterium]|nr:retropepsin-like aspartic protease [Candidatus Dormibacteraeota bacterium]